MQARTRPDEGHHRNHRALFSTRQRIAVLTFDGVDDAREWDEDLDALVRAARRVCATLVGVEVDTLRSAVANVQQWQGFVEVPR